MTTKETLICIFGVVVSVCMVFVVTFFTGVFIEKTINKLADRCHVEMVCGK